MAPRGTRIRCGIRAAAAAGFLAASVAAGAGHASAAGDYARIAGEGSSWAANAISDMQVRVAPYGMRVDYSPTGSTAGRQSFLNGTVDFAVSDIPFQFTPEDSSAPERPQAGSYAYVPIAGGGTSFMYNLRINGQRVSNLRLSGENIAKIFTGVITAWNDPALIADNPGLALPARPIVPVVRSDGAGPSSYFTQWMGARHPALWAAYCERSGRAPACGATSYYPTVAGMVAQNGDAAVAQFVSQPIAEGSIGYVNYSYALNLGFPVAKVLNSAGYYTEPTPLNVAVSLLRARVNHDASDPTTYLTQQLDDVYSDTDPRAYELSSYAYLIVPTGPINPDKGRALAAFGTFALCEAQERSVELGYAPLPINLVEAGFEQLRKVTGAEVATIDVEQCGNPTFSPDGTNLLAENAPMPQACDQRGPAQCVTGTGGMSGIPTTPSGPDPVVPEVPLAIALPLSGAAAIGLLSGARRRVTA